MIRKASKNDYPELLKVWENSVKATHSFLKKEDFEEIKSKIPIYFDQADLYIYKDLQGLIKGFIGVSGNKIEMLFIDSLCRGEGIGKKLLNFAINELRANEVDVNEQNQQAVGFYTYTGFEVIGRSETDMEGKPYPILHLKK